MRKIFLLPLILVIFFLSGCGSSSGNSADVGSNGTTNTAEPKVKDFKSDLKITMLNVGQGDSFLIQTKTQNILIDTSDMDERSKLVSELDKAGVTDIDKIILTHPHADHIGGIEKLLKDMTTGNNIIWVADDYKNFRAESENITRAFFAKIKMLLKSNEKNLVYAYFELVLAHLNNVQRRFSTAADYAESAYKKFVELDTSGENVILSLKILAAAYKGQGLNKKQIETQRQIVTATEKYFNDFEKTIAELENLYDVLTENNLRYDAIEVRRQMIDFYKNEYGAESEETLLAMGELADEWDDFRKFDKALEIRQEILEIIKGDTAAEIEAEKQIAYIYHHAKNYEKEIEHYEKVLELIRAESGEYSEDLMEPLSEMAETFWDINNFDEWGKKRDEIVEIYQQKISEESARRGENSREVVDVIQNLIHWLSKIEANEDVAKWDEILQQKKAAGNIQDKEYNFNFDDDEEEFEEGDELEELHNNFDELQEKLEKIFDSETFEEFLDVAKELVKFAVRNSEYADEVETLQEIIDALKDLFDKKLEMEIAAAVIDFSNRLTYSYIDSQDFDAAQNINDEMLNFSKENFGDYSDETISVLYAQGDLLFAGEKFEESLNCCRGIVNIFKDNRGDENFGHIVALKNLTVKLKDLQRYDEAVDAVFEIIDNYKKFHGEQILHFIDAYAHLAELYELKQDFDNALKWRQYVIDTYKKTWGPEKINTIDAIADKAATFEMAENFSDALELRKEVAKIYNLKKKKAGDDFFDENLQEAFENIISVLEKINPAEVEIWQKKIAALEDGSYNTEDEDLN